MRIVIAGGDRRMGYAGKCLKEKGFSICFWGCGEEVTSVLPKVDVLPFTHTPKADLLLLPAPLTRDNQSLFGTEGKFTLCRIEESLCHFPLAMGGGFTHAILEKAKTFRTKVLDLFQSEAYNMAIARITAESALGLLLLKSETAMSDMQVGILGYGRIGRALAKLLLFGKAEVSVFARGEEKPLLAKAEGVSHVYPMPPEKEGLSRLSVLVNTVPAPTLTPTLMEALPKNATLLELASGIQFPQNTGHTLLLGHGLPGKYMPFSAGRVVADFAEKAFYHHAC